MRREDAARARLRPIAGGGCGELLLPSIADPSPPFKEKRPPGLLARRSRIAPGAASAASVFLNVGALAPYAVEPGASSCSAPLDPALIRRVLVPHWGLSTFPGSGLLSYGRLA